MKRKLSLIGSIVNTVSILAFGVMYGIVFWVLASIFLKIGGKEVTIPSVLLFGAMLLIVICLILNIYMIAISVKKSDKYAKAKIGIFVTIFFNVLLTAYIVYLTTTVEQLLVLILLIVLAIIILADTALYIVDFIKEKHRRVDTYQNVSAATEVPSQDNNNQQ